jgi:putative transposase
MPWNQTEAMTERVKLITDYLSGTYGVSDLSRRYGVSRRTIYKWIGRHEKEGWRGLEEQSRAPHQQANALKPEIEEAILTLKARWVECEEFSKKKAGHGKEGSKQATQT